MSGPSDRRLIDAAIDAAGRAYAPYSRFHVGAAILMTDGRLGAGTNVENASYGLSLCAEANAIAALIGGGHGTIRQVAVVGWRADEPSERVLATPCGRCRQVIAEFAAADACVLVAYRDGTLALSVPVRDLLPHAFGPGALSDPRT